jgi:hypothetical protein
MALHRIYHPISKDAPSFPDAHYASETEGRFFPFMGLADDE